MTHWWAVLLVPTVGGLLCGLLVYGLAPEAEGHARTRWSEPFIAWSVASEGVCPLSNRSRRSSPLGPAGREGPIAQIGAGFGSFLAGKLGLGEHERRLLMLSGGAGGIGALFISEGLYGSTALADSTVCLDYSKCD